MNADESFEGLLLAFVEQRNLFVHHLQSQAWFDLESTTGINQIWQALGGYMHNLEQVALTFNTYWMRFAESTGAPRDESWTKLEQIGISSPFAGGLLPKTWICIKAEAPRTSAGFGRRLAAKPQKLEKRAVGV